MEPLNVEVAEKAYYTYIPDYHIRRKKECDERKAEIEKEIEKDVKVDIWNKLYDIFHEHPVEATFEDLKKVIRKHAEYLK